MKSQCRSTDLNEGKTVRETSRAQQKITTQDIRSVVSDQDKKMAINQIENTHFNVQAGAPFKPSHRNREGRQSDLSSIVPPICHDNKPLEQSHSMVSTSFVKEIEGKKRRLRLDQPTRLVDITLRDARKHENELNDETFTVPNQTQLNKLFRMKLEAARFLEELSASKESIDTLNNATSKMQLVEYTVRVLQKMCGSATSPKEQNHEASSLEFAKANNDLLMSSLAKTKELLEKTRKEWSDVCEKLTEKDLQLEKAQEQLFRWQRLYEEEKIKRNSRKSSEKELSVTVNEMKACMQASSKEKKELLGTIEKQNCMIEQLVNERNEFNAEVERLNNIIEAVQQKPNWMEQQRKSIVRLYEEHLLLLAKDRDRHGTVFHEFEKFIKESEGRPAEVRVPLHRYQHIPTATSIHYNPLPSTRPRSTDCNFKFPTTNNPSVCSRPSSVNFNKSRVLPCPTVAPEQKDTSKIEQKYRQKLEKMSAENQELKEELSKITDKCIEFGMLKELMEEKPLPKATTGVQKTPPREKETLKLSPRNQPSPGPSTETFHTFRKTE